MTSELIELLAKLDFKGMALEVGSLDINGSARELFDDYTGVDIEAGKNVDIVASGHDLPFKDETFDLVLCMNTLEHDDTFWLTVAEMKRVLKKGGILFIEVPNYSYGTIQNWPADYWRFSDQAIAKMLEGMDEIKVALIPGRHDLIYGHGKKA